MARKQYRTTSIAKIKLMFRTNGLNIMDIDGSKNIWDEYARLLAEKRKMDFLEQEQKKLAQETAIDAAAITPVEKKPTIFDAIQKPMSWDEYCKHMVEKDEGWIEWDSHYKFGKVLVRVKPEATE